MEQSTKQEIDEMKEGTRMTDIKQIPKNLFLLPLIVSILIYKVLNFCLISVHMKSIYLISV